MSILTKFGKPMVYDGAWVTCADPADSPCCVINCIGCAYSTIEGIAPTVAVSGLSPGTGTAPIPGDCGFDVPPCANCGDLNTTYVLAFINQVSNPDVPDAIACLWAVDGDAIACGVPAGCNGTETLGATVSLTILFNYSGSDIDMGTDDFAGTGMATPFLVPPGHTGILVELDLYEQHSGFADAQSTSYYGDTVEGQFACSGSIELPYLGHPVVESSPDTQICNAPAASMTVNFS